MRQIDLSTLDLNLLTVFATLMRERSVTRAAAVLHRGQPAVSHSLRQLRDLLGDPLFTRAGRSIEPTARAIELHALVGPALDALVGAVRTTRHFDPATDPATFRLGLTDDLQLALLPTIVARLRADMPHAQLVVRNTDYARAFGMLESGEVSTLIGVVENLPAQARLRTLGKVSFRVLRARDEDEVLDLNLYCRRPHVVVSSIGDLSGVIDDVLHGLGRSRRIIASLPLFGGLAPMLVGSDLLATVPDHLARMSGCGSLRSDSLPFEAAGYTVSMAWRAMMDRDPTEKRFRALLLDAAQSVLWPRQPKGSVGE